MSIHKKLTTAIFSLLLLSVGVSGYSQVKIGFTHGLANTSVSADGYGVVPREDQSKFSGGPASRTAIFAFIPLSNFFSLRPEVALFSAGFTEQTDTAWDQVSYPPGWTDNVSATSKHRFYNLQVPILINFSFHLADLGKRTEDPAQQKTLSMDIFAGPTLSYTVKARSQVSKQLTRSSSNDPSSEFNFTTREQTNVDLKSDKVNYYDWGITGGVGIKGRLNKYLWLCVEARHSVLFSNNLNKGHWDRTTPDPEKIGQHKHESPVIKLKHSPIISVGLIVGVNFKKLKLSPEH